MVASSRVFFSVFLLILSLSINLQTARAITSVKNLPDDTIWADDFEDSGASGAAVLNWFQNDECTGDTFLLDGTRSHTGSISARMFIPTGAACDADLRHTIDASTDIASWSIWVAFSSQWLLSGSSGAGLFLSLEYWASDACSPPSINCATAWTTGDNVRYEARLYIDPFNKKIYYTSLVGGTPTTINIGNLEFWRPYNTTSIVRDNEAWTNLRVVANRATHKFIEIQAGHQHITNPCGLPNGCDLPFYLDNTGLGTGASCSAAPSSYCTSGYWGLEAGVIAAPAGRTNPLIVYWDDALFTDETPGAPGIVQFSLWQSAYIISAFIGFLVVAILGKTATIDDETKRNEYLGKAWKISLILAMMATIIFLVGIMLAG